MSRKFTAWEMLSRSDEHISFMIGKDHTLFNSSSQKGFRTAVKNRQKLQPGKLENEMNFLRLYMVGQTWQLVSSLHPDRNMSGWELKW